MKSRNDIVRQIPLFSVCGDPFLNTLLSDAPMRECGSGDCLCRAGEPLSALVLLLSGRLTVLAADGTTVLRTITAPGLFGLSTLFGDGDRSVSTVCSRGKSRVLYLPKDRLERALRSDADFALRYIGLLSSRIRFLNERIGTFTASGTEKRLADYLCRLPYDGDGKCRLTVSLSTLADMLSVGRASLYRAFDALAAQGLAFREGKTVSVPDRAALQALAQGCAQSDPM